MKQKIKWYQEVLDLEPGSKVFFPLSKMQAEDGQLEAAITTLKKGLTRYPEHLEARLLFIDLLFKQKQLDSVWPEVDQVTAMLEAYPGFWSAWTALLSRNPNSKDAALALTFLSANLSGKSISWSDIIAHGLSQILSNDLPAAALVPPVQPATTFKAPEFVAGSGVEVNEIFTPVEDLPPVNMANEPSADVLPEFALDFDADQDEDFDAETEESFSLNTRSMAEVLAEQGDYTGALNIYEELLSASDNPVDQEELQSTIAALSSKASMAVGTLAGADLASDSLADDTTPKNSIGNSRLLDVLEALAERLESKF